MSTLGILHRDIKLKNIFIGALWIAHTHNASPHGWVDAKGDCKGVFYLCLSLYLIKRMVVGDFGLATSSLAAVDPSDVSPHAVVLDADMTLGVWFYPCASFFPAGR
jgi:translation initiation factor 2-alpha kinase 4